MKPKLGAMSIGLLTAASTAFNPGDVAKEITFNITDDTTAESAEVFFVQLSNASPGVTIVDGQGQGVINDDDANILISDVSGNEGNLAKGKKNSGSASYKDFVFTISLSNPVGHSVTVDYATVDGTATIANNDYLAVGATVTFAPGQTSKTVTVQVVGDNDQEPDESFSVQLSNAVGGTLSDAVAVGSILDDDSGGGGNGGGKGGGKGNRAPFEDATVEVQDAIWWFEGPDATEHHHHAEHHHHTEESADNSFADLLRVRLLGSSAAETNGASAIRDFRLPLAKNLSRPSDRTLSTAQDAEPASEQAAPLSILEGIQELAGDGDATCEVATLLALGVDVNALTDTLDLPELRETP